MSELKRYLLFAGCCYYAEGGFADFRGSFDTVEDAKKCFGDHLIEKFYRGGYISHWGEIIEIVTEDGAIKYNHISKTVVEVINSKMTIEEWEEDLLS